MDYKESVEYLYNSRPYGKIKYGLFRMKELMDRMGNPQDSYPVIHITGTNGKGSVAAMITSVLVQMGLKVGLNISPHIISFRERLQINRQLVPEHKVAELLEDIVPHLHEMDKKGEEFSPSFFEVVTAMAFHYFRQENVDVAVIEVGLGGRYDASNILKKPLVSVITTVGLDHRKILGNTEKEISREKAGIIKPGVPVVSGVTRPSIRRVIEGIARENDSESFFLWHHFDAKPIKMALGNNLFEYIGENYYGDLVMPLNGTHQYQNAAIAIKTLEIAVKGLKENLSVDVLRQGLSKTQWPGRFESLRAFGKQIVLDGAHNPDGIRTFVESVRSYFNNQRIRILFGVLDDKDYINNIRLLSEIVDEVIVTKVSSHRSNSPERVFREWKKYRDNAIYIENPKDAFCELLNTEKPVVFCVGSLYLISEIRNVIFGGKENA
ncbi:folylpolyglutamate synthase [Kosmotoga arenicorallina S304]|uniref:tetrahydrofolate synthase n=1 Tax=Kosmotoga arenicorallina S304 TaxID=1453497 RepID=A0A176K0J3_9BACT|nr:folylpolyglutamate synthase/dihydrofolate synthase family protein [Kosmotoga arenicorallina]OAA29764.1 folylpolyglutamate synthase [Kosmotoga arenicorallina S304]